MLANNLTLEEEDSVQAELLELQAEQVGLTSISRGTRLLTPMELKAPEETPQIDQKAADILPSVPSTEPASPVETPVKEERIAIPA